MEKFRQKISKIIISNTMTMMIIFLLFTSKIIFEILPLEGLKHYTRI